MDHWVTFQFDKWFPFRLKLTWFNLCRHAALFHSLLLLPSYQLAGWLCVQYQLSVVCQAWIGFYNPSASFVVIVQSLFCVAKLSCPVTWKWMLNKFGQRCCKWMFMDTSTGISIWCTVTRLFKGQTRELVKILWCHINRSQPSVTIEVVL